MDETVIGSEIIDTNQHFIFLYDFAKSWTFLIELIQVVKNVDADMTLDYPLVSRIEGVGPMQYGTKGLLGPKFADIEEKYDLAEAADGYGEEGETDAHTLEEGGLDDEEGEEEEQEDSNDSSEDSGSEFFDEEAY
jgi:hypothetical protein